MEYHTVFFHEKKTKKFLKRFDMANNKVLNKFFWEKTKREELLKLLKVKDLDEQDVIMTEHIGQSDTSE